MSFLRKTSIVASYAKYHNIPNEVSAPPKGGVDMFTISFEVGSILSYIPSSYIIDKFGISFIILGSFMCSVANWIWYVAGKNTHLVVFANFVLGMFGSMIAVGLLAITNRWFKPDERTKATAFGNLMCNFGGFLGIIMPIFLRKQVDHVIDSSLLSCNVSKLNDVFPFYKGDEFKVSCDGDYGKAKDLFCCYLPVDIPKLNFILALISTCTFIFTFLTVRNLPPVPPAPSGKYKTHKGFFKSLRSVFQRRNALVLTISELIMVGPPFLIINTLSRIVPSTVSRFAIPAVLGGFTLAFPVTLYVAHLVDKTKYYFSVVLVTFISSAVLWLCMSLSRISDSLLDSYVFTAFLILALISYVVFEAPVYELKLEYAFDEDLSVEGAVIATDKTATSISNFFFVSLLSPERVRSSANSIFIGCAVLFFGCSVLIFLKNPYDYNRLRYDKEVVYHNSRKNDGSQKKY